MLKTYLDDTLKLLNDDYAVERSAVLKDIIVEVVPTELFYKWHKIEGKMGGQNKFPRVMKKEKFQKWEAFITTQMSQ